MAGSRSLLIPTLLGSVVLLGVGAPSHAQAPAGRTLASYDFSDSAQGWRISGDTDPMPSLHNRTGGQEGGCIEGTDQALGETWYFAAPSDLVAQLPAALDGTLSYWIRQSGAMVSVIDDDVVIVGRAGRLSYRFPGAPGTAWTAMSVRLSASSGWVWNWNRPATEEQVRQVLDTAIRLEIRGEYVTGDDSAALDTVVLTAGVR